MSRPATTHNSNYTAIPFPKIRLGAIDLLKKGARMHIINGLLEIDVNKPRQYIRDRKAMTGETLSVNLSHCAWDERSTKAK